MIKAGEGKKKHLSLVILCDCLVGISDPVQSITVRLEEKEFLAIMCTSRTTLLDIMYITYDMYHSKKALCTRESETRKVV